MNTFKETLFNHFVIHDFHGVVVVFKVQEDDRMIDVPEFYKRDDFRDLLKSSGPAGKSDKGVPEFDHFCAAFRHGLSDDQLGDRVMLQFRFDKKGRLYTDDFTACTQDRIRQHTHQTCPAAAIDETVSALSDPFAKTLCLHTVHFVNAIACSQIDGDVHRCTGPFLYTVSKYNRIFHSSQYFCNFYTIIPILQGIFCRKCITQAGGSAIINTVWHSF